MPSDLPSGTVTFLFTDVEGSTRLLDELGAETYARVLSEHRRVVCDATESFDGVVVDTQGDAFFLAFARPLDAVRAADSITEQLLSGPIRLRIGVHTGTPLVVDKEYVGADVHRAARIAAAGHGGQVLVSAATAALVDVSLRDLGEHRFKDLRKAQRVFQLGEIDFPPLKSLYWSNLPVPDTPFLGRDEELAQLSSLLAEIETRLLSLVGPGGAGKTRLALQAVGRASDGFAGGVYWVSLAEVRDVDALLPTVAAALGIAQRSSGHPLQDLVGAIAGRRLLLLLDNVEHLLPAAAAEIAALVLRAQAW